ncbi:hypothetical protein Sme01_17880 [Sphaerisporangium melleum]|uniref:Uncharacterized protein n=1 Tax=Sphaerisporangium melleum TaxID=321316 RepID=A0A917R1I8_9ACTN|nr:hypothetical protein GCM10007964_27820 [Sphaerisporangium melleum]GII69312.1 hypothetical protein Sme01_17880 [Sphaerisporangium melleum]
MGSEGTFRVYGRRGGTGFGGAPTPARGVAGPAGRRIGGGTGSGGGRGPAGGAGPDADMTGWGAGR